MAQAVPEIPEAAWHEAVVTCFVDRVPTGSIAYGFKDKVGRWISIGKPPKTQPVEARRGLSGSPFRMVKGDDSHDIGVRVARLREDFGVMIPPEGHLSHGQGNSTPKPASTGAPALTIQQGVRKRSFA
jgi:hypothetical protein